MNHSINQTDISELERIMGKCIQIFGHSPTGLTSNYGELFVFNELKEFKPKIGKDRRDKTADIFLDDYNNRKLRVEVKTSQGFPNTSNCWGFSFGASRIPENNSFDLLVSIALKVNESGEIRRVHELAFSKNQLFGIEKLRGLGGREQFFVHYHDMNGTFPKNFPPKDIEKRISQVDRI